MTTTYTNPTLHWYRTDGGYMNREGFGLLLCWEGRYVWQAPHKSVIEIKAKSCVGATRMISGLVKAISVAHGSQWRGYCTACGTSLRSYDDEQGLAEAIITHLRASPTSHPEFVRYA